MAKYVITGGPGVGKTTICEELGKLGYDIVPESARAIIAEEQQKPQGMLPWLGKDHYFAFQSKVLDRQLGLKSRINGKPTFLDRGVLDNIAYCRVGGVPLPRGLAKAAQEPRYDAIFILDRLTGYKTDEQRKEAEEEARQLHATIVDVYKEHGYAPITVPAIGIRPRVDFIIKKIKELEGTYGLH